MIIFGFVTLSIYLLSMETNKNKKIILRITESQLAKIVAETKRQKMNKSSLVRTVLDEYFAQKLSEEIMDKYRVKKHIN